MNHTWGVYNLQGKAADGTHVAVKDPRAVRWFVRWRVNGGEHKRTLKQKGHATTFRNSLISAQDQGLEADDRGYPIKPASVASIASAAEPVQVPPSRSFERYCLDVWWPNEGQDKEPRNRTGHHKNMRDAIAWLRYQPDDPRVDLKPNTGAGMSIRLDDLNSDDIKAALRRRRNHNDRTDAANARRIAAALEKGDDVAVEVKPSIASDRTVRAFWITLGMIVRAAAASRQTDRGCLEGGAVSLAPIPKPKPVSHRIVPSIQEVFDLSDAISQLGPRMPDGRPSGERLRALILAAGTLGPRPGELTAHQPDWFEDEDDLTYMMFRQTESVHYDKEAGVSGHIVGPLKHREPGDYRSVPALQDVVQTLRLHFERGYALPDRTFSSPGGTAHLRWGNLTDVYWRPACEKVFGATSKPMLASMTPNTLRKAAITFWLDSGITMVQAGEWAGHSEDVQQRHYAGRVTPGLAKEAAMLASGAATLRHPGRAA